MWQQWINAVLGLWVLALAFMGAEFSWTLAITGVAVAALGIWGATEHNAMTEHRGTRMAMR